MFGEGCAARGNRMQFVIAAAAILACGPALAQQNEAITVTAAHSVTHKYVGRTSTGFPIEEASFSQRLGYRDLNLNTPAGAKALKQRVAAIADAGCSQLAQSQQNDSEVLLPSSKTCQEEAMDTAIPQAEAAILAARK